MRTRNRLNLSFIGGSLTLAALAGVVTQSGTIFVIALVVLLGLNIYHEEIR